MVPGLVNAQSEPNQNLWTQQIQFKDVFAALSAPLPRNLPRLGRGVHVMVDTNRVLGEGAEDGRSLTEHGPIPPFDAAAYVFHILGELSAMSHRSNLGPLAAALEMARDVASQAMVEARQRANTGG